jgi:hypothetical protein
MDDRTNKEAPAVDPAEANSLRTASSTERENNSTKGGGSKARDAAERLLALYGCDAKAHVEQRGFKNIREDGKHLFDKPQTVHTPLSVFHVKAHLMGKYRVSCVPLLANDTAVCGRIDVDLYGIDRPDIVDLCDRVADFSLPLYVSNSKSGARILIFSANSHWQRAPCERPCKPWSGRSVCQVTSVK